MAHDVFISYSSKDKAIADGVCAALEVARIRCWIAPRDILAGRTFAEAIAEAIAASRAMVLIYSRNSSISEDVLRELTLAVTSNVVVIPFRIEEAPLEGAMKYYLSGTHWLDAVNPPTEIQIRQLVATIKPFVERGSLSVANEAPSPEDAGAKHAQKLFPRQDPISAESGPNPTVPTRNSVVSAGVIARRPWLAAIPIVSLVLLAAVWMSWGKGVPGSPSITELSPLRGATSAEPDRKPAAQATAASAVVSAPISGPPARDTQTVTPVPPAAPAVVPTATPTASPPGVISPGTAPGLRLRTTLTGHTGPVNSVIFSWDGKALVSGSDDGTVKMWDAADHKELKTINPTLDSQVGRVALSSDGKTLAVGFVRGGIKMFDVASGEETRTINAHRQQLNGMVLSPDGKILASASADNTVKLWDVSNGKGLKTFAGHPSTQMAPGIISNGAVSSVAVSPDGTVIAVGNGGDFTVSLWDVGTGKEVHTLNDNSTAGPWVSLAFSFDGKMLASGRVGLQVKTWDVSSGRVLRSLKGHTAQYVRGLAFSPDGSVLASGAEDKVIKLWDVASGTELDTLTGHEGAILSLAFSPDGKTLASASGDNTVRLWTLPSH